ncbi:MAG: hypothetical protein L0Z62_13020 [Gemmataceae bacterium]|nr:hypothetical protein [Gemmataceae bacterium]
MRRLLCRCLLLAALAALATAPGFGQGPPMQPPTPGGKPAPPPVGPPEPAKQDGVKRLPLDKIKLPPGSILVICDELKDGLTLSPRMMVVSPERFQELSDRITQLERQIKPERKVPSSCKLRANVEGDFVYLQAEFELIARQPRTHVFLGCRGAQATEARLREGDDKETGFVLLDHGQGGYSVLLERPGKYRLTLGLRLPAAFTASAASRGAERSFELGLPGAAVTVLTLELPQPVREVRLTRTLPEKKERETSAERARGGGKQKRWEEIPLGPVTNLQAAWHEPINLPDTGPLLSARGQVTVRLEQQHVVTTAELTLLDLRGQAREWKLWLPPQARIKLTAPEGLAHKIQPLGNNVHLLQLTEPAPEGIKLTVTVERPRPFPRLPIGPFVVLDAFRQEGTIEVRASPAARRGARLQYTLHGEIEEREAPRDHPADLIAYFRYWNMSIPAKLAASPGGKIPAPGTAPLDIEVKTSRGPVQTRVEHRLRLRQDEQALKLIVETRIRARPLGEAVDFLDVQLPRPRPDTLAPLAGPNPAPFPATLPWAALAAAARAPQEPEWQSGGAEVQFPEGPAKGPRRARVRLSALAKESLVVLTGTYTLPADSRHVRLELLRPLTIKDDGAEVKVEADERLELLLPGPGPEVPAPGRHQYTFESETAPAFVELAWRPYRPERSAAIEADVTFHERDAHVRQRLTLPSLDPQGAGGGKAQPIKLRVPAAAKGLEVSAPWKLLERNKELALVTLAPGATAKEPLILDYDFRLPRPDRDGKDRGKKEAEAEVPPVEVPLAWPLEATRARTKVRLWTVPGILPALADAGPDELTWKERGTEVVPGKGLPARVLLGEGLNLPLLVRLDPVAPSLAGVVIDRALVQVRVDEEGAEHYRARFLVTRVNANHLDVKLPAASSPLSLQIKLGGEPAAYRGVRDGTGQVAHIPLDPGLFTRPVVLEVSYQLPRNQPESEELWQTVLHPPEIAGNVFLGRVRWQVTLPAHWIPVVMGADAHVEQEWGWQGWLPGPEPALSSDQLETWLTGRPAADEGVVPSLVCSRTSLQPLRLLRPPQQLWFLVCSGVLLVVGLGLYFAPLSGYGFWFVVALLTVGVVAAGFLWPSVVPAVLYGCQPGAVVLVVLIGFQWMLQQRYRRQVVFLPGFKRVKAGSSLVRNATRPREPSTVDASPSNPPAPSGQASGVGPGRS